MVKTYGHIGLGAMPMRGETGNEAIQFRNSLQAAIMNNSRLKIPVSFHQETLHGAMAGVIFPMPVSQGATWNVQLVEQIASIIALEAWATGTDRGFSPELNVPTDPRFGRLEENFGEDPVLVRYLIDYDILGGKGK